MPRAVRTGRCTVARRDGDDEIVVRHLAHLVQGAPSVRALATLPLDWEAERPDVDSPWVSRPIG